MWRIQPVGLYSTHDFLTVLEVTASVSICRKPENDVFRSRKRTMLSAVYQVCVWQHRLLHGRTSESINTSPYTLKSSLAGTEMKNLADTKIKYQNKMSSSSSSSSMLGAWTDMTASSLPPMACFSICSCQTLRTRSCFSRAISFFCWTFFNRKKSSLSPSSSSVMM